MLHKRGEKLTNLFYEANITLILILDKIVQGHKIMTNLPYEHK